MFSHRGLSRGGGHSTATGGGPFLPPRVPEATAEEEERHRRRRSGIGDAEEGVDPGLRKGDLIDSNDISYMTRPLKPEGVSDFAGYWTSAECEKGVPNDIALQIADGSLPSSRTKHRMAQVILAGVVGLREANGSGTQ